MTSPLPGAAPPVTPPRDTTKIWLAANLVLGMLLLSVCNLLGAVFALLALRAKRQGDTAARSVFLRLTHVLGVIGLVLGLVVGAGAFALLVRYGLL